MRLCIFFLILSPAYSASVEGVIRTNEGAAVASASIRLQLTSAGKDTLSTTSDASGKYRFASLDQGSYSMRAVKADFNETVFGPFELAPGESKKLDLILKPALPDFFDEPNFTVAGVSNYSYVGGHGSEPVKRATDALVHAAASLIEEGPAMAKAYEKANDPLDALHEYQRAAEDNPNETNLFNWGAELLNHGAPDAASEVFKKGIRLFPRSSRLLIADGVAHYVKADYANARQRFFAAADIDPLDPLPYVFLGKVESNEITDSPGYLELLARFAKLHPEMASANYYYGAALWKTRTADAKALLEKAASLDPNFAAVHLQLGIIHSSEGNLQAAIVEYRKALAAEPDSEQVHYRLAQAYRQAGQSADAQRELETFEKIARSTTEKLDRERSELKQFVVTLKPKK